MTEGCADYMGTADMPVILRGKVKKEGVYYMTVFGLETVINVVSVEVERVSAESVIPLANGNWCGGDS